MAGLDAVYLRHACMLILEEGQEGRVEVGNGITVGVDLGMGDEVSDRLVRPGPGLVYSGSLDRIVCDVGRVLVDMKPGRAGIVGRGRHVVHGNACLVPVAYLRICVLISSILRVLAEFMFRPLGYVRPSLGLGAGFARTNTPIMSPRVQCGGGEWGQTWTALSNGGAAEERFEYGAFFYYFVSRLSQGIKRLGDIVTIDGPRKVVVSSMQLWHLGR